jgi:hypothetical protein
VPFSCLRLIDIFFTYSGVTIKNQLLPTDPRSIKNIDEASLEFLTNSKKRDILSKTISL